MEWHERSGVRWLEADLPDARAVFSTRSAGSIKKSPVALADAVGIDPSCIVSGRQVHGAELVCRDAPGGGTPAVDGQVLTAPGPVGLVYTADCLPVAVAGPRGAAVLHCGWRGLAAGIVARGCEAVAATHAAIGPGIGPCCYEVGDEVFAAFEELGPGLAEGRTLDLSEVAQRQLRAAGVAEIDSAGLCTRCKADLFFSHRRDRGPGRQAGLAWLERGAA